MTSMGAQCCQKEFKSFQVLATAATMNMRKKHGKTLSSVVDSRRKFGERHILRDGLRLRRGVGNQKGSMGPPKFRQNSAKVETILKGSLASVKIQIMGGKVYLR